MWTKKIKIFHTKILRDTLVRSRTKLTHLSKVNLKVHVDKKIKIFHTKILRVTLVHSSTKLTHLSKENLRVHVDKKKIQIFHTKILWDTGTLLYEIDASFYSQYESTCGQKNHIFHTKILRDTLVRFHTKLTHLSKVNMKVHVDKKN